MGKTILITGGAGFIGSHICDNLLNAGYNVIVLDNLSSGALCNLKEHENLKFYKADICTDDIEYIFVNERPDFVIHLAAQTSVAYSVKNPFEDANMNILASIKLVELSKKYKIKKFITASSAAVYGNPKYLPMDESHPTEPMSPYGLSKLTMEKYIQLSDIPYIIFRFSNAYGPRQKSSKESGVIAIFDEAMRNNKPINIYGDGEQIRDFIYVEDIADICVKVLKSNIKNEIINFSTNKGKSLNELYSLMKNIYKYQKDIRYLPERIGEIRDSVLSNKKAKALFNDISITELNTGIKNLKNKLLIEDELYT